MVAWYFLILMRLAIDSFTCFWKSLTSIFYLTGDLGPKRPPPLPQNLALWAPNLNYRWVPGNHVSFRRVISIDKSSWTPFPIWAWVCDQLYVDLLRGFVALLWNYVRPSSSFVATLLTEYKKLIVERKRLFLLFIIKLENKLYKNMKLSLQKIVYDWNS